MLRYCLLVHDGLEKPIGYRTKICFGNSSLRSRALLLPVSWGETLSSLKSTGETFADVLKTEAAKNKSLKINHAALQRVMNNDGSLKRIDGEHSWKETLEQCKSPFADLGLPPVEYRVREGFSLGPLVKEGLRDSMNDGASARSRIVV